jgi:hypothetical protein
MKPVGSLFWGLWRGAVAVTGLLVVLPLGTRAQASGGSAGLAVVGGAFGGSAGAILGLMGSIPPCWQTTAGVRCVRVGAGVGTAVGLASGIALGAVDGDRLGKAGTSAAIGLGVGVVAGLALTPIAQRFTWRDVTAMGLMGGAIGSAPIGSAIGFAAGGVVGAVLWQAVDDFTLPDAVGAGIVGMAIGALTQWVVVAANAQGDPAQPAGQVVLPISVRF